MVVVVSWGLAGVVASSGGGGVARAGLEAEAEVQRLRASRDCAVSPRPAGGEAVQG